MQQDAITPGRIAARSRGEALDWSLVLISQGIESVIDQSDELGWGVIVSPEQQPAAAAILKVWQNENRHWPWRQPIPANMFFDWAALAWVTLMILFYWLQTNFPGIQSAGMMNSVAVSSGEWWRLFTATCLHGDAAHLAGNTSLGLVLLGLTMGRFGTGVGLFAAFLAGAGGNVLTWLAFPDHRSLGASGMVLGCVGLLAAQAVSFKRHPGAFKYALTAIAAGAMLFVLLGLNPDTDVLAHFGGFLAGLLLGTVVLAMRRPFTTSRVNALAGLLYALLLVASWWQALVHIR